MLSLESCQSIILIV